jgi:molybdopterin-guanine dinucleotide biosynthesis protein A
MDVRSVRPGVAGVILVGGRSRRMGRDKALLPFPHGSALTFVERLSTLLTELCGEVLLVARDETRGREYSFVCQRQNVRLVYDQAADHGPLMGLYSGLHAVSFSHALVLAVDLPLVRRSLLSWLSAFPLTDEILMPRVQGIPQVLLARYPRSLLPTIELCLRLGRRNPRSLLAQAPVRFLEEAELREIDPDLRSFVNVNTPEDFEQARFFW